MVRRNNKWSFSGLYLCDDRFCLVTQLNFGWPIIPRTIIQMYSWWMITQYIYLSTWHCIGWTLFYLICLLWHFIIQIVIEPWKDGMRRVSYNMPKKGMRPKTRLEAIEKVIVSGHFEFLYLKFACDLSCYQGAIIGWWKR